MDNFEPGQIVMLQTNYGRFKAGSIGRVVKQVTSYSNDYPLVEVIMITPPLEGPDDERDTILYDYRLKRV
jgi:hypothetical protein